MGIVQDPRERVRRATGGPDWNANLMYTSLLGPLTHPPTHPPTVVAGTVVLDDWSTAGRGLLPGGQECAGEGGGAKGGC